jgi:hypothetical protein
MASMTASVGERRVTPGSNNPLKAESISPFNNYLTGRRK